MWTGLGEITRPEIECDVTAGVDKKKNWLYVEGTKMLHRKVCGGGICRDETEGTGPRYLGMRRSITRAGEGRMQPG